MEILAGYESSMNDKDKLFLDSDPEAYIATQKGHPLTGSAGSPTLRISTMRQC